MGFDPAHILSRKRFIVIGITAGLLYWVLEAALDASLFFSHGFIQQLVNPGLHEIWMRSIGVAFLIGLGITAHVLTHKSGRLNRVLDALRGVNQIALRADDAETLLGEVCETLVEKQGYYNTWIALQDTDDSFRKACAAGMGVRFQRVDHGLQAGILPPCGEKALSRPGVVVINDPPSECEECPLSEYYAGRAGLASRLAYGGRIYGFICASVPARFADDSQEQDLFEEMADDIAFALHDIELEEKVRESEREKRLILNNTDEIIALHDTDHNLQWANRAYLQAMDSSLAEVKGQKCYHVWGARQTLQQVSRHKGHRNRRTPSSRINAAKSRGLGRRSRLLVVKSSPCQR